MLNYFQGDTIEQEFKLWENRKLNLPLNLTGYEIRFQLQGKDTRNRNIKLKKATANVVGGSNNQILLTNAQSGTFVVTISKEESQQLLIGKYLYEIELTKGDYRKTFVQNEIIIESTLINWISK
jgi:hypothetical protein